MSSSRLVRAGMMVVALAALLVVAGCSGFRPVYGGNTIGRGDMAFRYSEPQSRLEQLVVQDLALRLGRDDSESSPLVRIIVQSSSRALTRTNVSKPVTQYEAEVTANYAVVVDGRTVASGSRKASASYSGSGQVMANDAARADALERAAHAVADLVRLAILGQLATPAREAAFAQ